MTNASRKKKPSLTLGQLLDIWIEEDLKVGSMSNGTVTLYQNIVRVIKRHPICNKPLSSINSDQLQMFMDLVTCGGKEGNFDSHDGYNNDYAKKPFTVLNHAFRFAVFPKKYIEFNPMQYVVIHKQKRKGVNNYHCLHNYHCGMSFLYNSVFLVYL